MEHNDSEKLFDELKKQEISIIDEEEDKLFTKEILLRLEKEDQTLEEEAQDDLMRELIKYSKCLYPDTQEKIQLCLNKQNLICYHISKTLKKHYKKVEMKLISKEDKDTYYIRIIEKPMFSELHICKLIGDMKKENRNALIYELYTEAKHTQEFIAKIFNLNQSTVCNIIKNFSNTYNTDHPRLRKLK